MRQNFFNDAYCHTSLEITEVMADKGARVDEINVDLFFDEDEDGWGGEIRLNESGETVCYFEGFASEHEARVTLMDAGIAPGDINVL